MYIITRVIASAKKSRGLLNKINLACYSNAIGGSDKAIKNGMNSNQRKYIEYVRDYSQTTGTHIWLGGSFQYGFFAHTIEQCCLCTGKIDVGWEI